MDHPPKTIPDRAFAEHVHREHAILAQQHPINAAELAAVRELLGFLAELVELGDERRFEKKAAARVVIARDKYKGWIAFATTVGGFLAFLFATYVSLGK